MAFYDAWFKKTTVTPKTGQFFMPVGEVTPFTSKEFLGLVDRKLPMGFQRNIGEEHTFDPRVTEGLYKRFGLVNGVVDKYVDYIWGPGIYVSSEDGKKGAQAVKIIEDFIRDNQFGSLGRQWIKEALLKPGGYLELGGMKNESVQGMKILDGKYMFIRRDEKGKLLGYSQYVGGFKKVESDKMIPFLPFQIAALHFNVVGDSPYGLGIVYPALSKIDQLIGLDKDIHTIIKRKANNPLHIKIGSTEPGQEYIPSADQIAAVRNELETLTPRTEWATDPYWDIKSVDTGNIGEKFDVALKHDIDMLVFAFQVPEVLLGRGSIPEGLAMVQSEAFERRIMSFQEEIEKVLEQQIFKRVLQSNGIDVDIEVHWGQPSTNQKMQRIEMLKGLLLLPELHPDLRTALQMQIADLLDLNPEDYEDAAEQREKELRMSQPKVPGQGKKASLAPDILIESPTHSGREEGGTMVGAEESSTSTTISAAIDPFGDNSTVHEWLGFNYIDLVQFIEEAVMSDGFDNLKAISTIEMHAGKLSDIQVDRLREVLRDGFRSGKSMRSIAADIASEVQPKDLLAIKGAGLDYDGEGKPIVVASAENRPLLIARTEVTRMGMEGSRRYYDEQGFDKYRWVASLGARTCPECEAMNGRIFNVLEDVPEPLHTSCRCSITPVTKLG